MSKSAPQTVRTRVLEVAYEETGRPEGWPVVLLHGFPQDVRSYDAVASQLAGEGARVIVPYLRGFGPTRFLDQETLRSGQQAALGSDLVELMDALGIEHAIVAGYDWGGRAACIAAALWPDRVDGLVSVDGYNIQYLPGAHEPAPPAHERSYWYQFYFHSERGRRGLEENREELCELLWATWSPTWAEARSAFARSAASLRNPDFVDVVIHSYRHRFGLVSGDARYDAVEAQLEARPAIPVPCVAIESGADGVLGSTVGEDRDQFTGAYEYLYLPDIGHNVPQEDPASFATAVQRA